MTGSDRAGQPDFAPVLHLIRQAQARALHGVNRELIGLYWQVGGYVQQRIEADGWGRGTVQQLAAWLAREHPDLKGFSSVNLWRMRQFYEAYRDRPELSAVLRELSWTNNITILARSASPALARYLTQVPDKALLQAKLNEFYALEQGEKEGTHLDD